MRLHDPAGDNQGKRLAVGAELRRGASPSPPASVFFFLKRQPQTSGPQKNITLVSRSPFTPFSSATASTPARGEETNDEVICFSLSLPMQSRLCGYVGQRAAEWIIQGPVLPFKTSFIEFTESQVAPLPLCAPLLFLF